MKSMKTFILENDFSPDICPAAVLSGPKQKHSYCFEAVAIQKRIIYFGDLMMPCTNSNATPVYTVDHKFDHR